MPCPAISLGTPCDTAMQAQIPYVLRLRVFPGSLYSPRQRLRLDPTERFSVSVRARSPECQQSSSKRLGSPAITGYTIFFALTTKRQTLGDHFPCSSFYVPCCWSFYSPHALTCPAARGSKSRQRGQLSRRAASALRAPQPVLPLPLLRQRSHRHLPLPRPLPRLESTFTTVTTSSSSTATSSASNFSTWRASLTHW